MKRPTVLVLTTLAVAMASALAAAAGITPTSAPQRSGKQHGNESWQIEQRKRWFIESRGLDKSTDAGKHRTRALQTLRQQSIARANIDLASGEIWTPIGPAAMKMGQWEMGPVSGRITVVTPQPGDDNTVYVGTANGGVWKTTNAGASWTPLFDNVGTQPVGSIFIEANNTQNIWVGSGDRNGLCKGYNGEGIYFSADGGATWALKNGGTSMRLGIITSLVRHPSDSNVLLAAGTVGYGCGNNANGIFRSADRGASWTSVLNNSIEDIAFVGNTSTAYATGGDGAYKSTNGGTSWTKIGGSTIVTNGRARLALAPSDPNTIYVLGADDLYRSSNGGTSWTKRHDAPCEGQCGYDLTMAVHPTNPNEILVGSIRFSRSTDGGTTLTPLTDTWGSTQKVHQDTHVLRYSTQNSNRFWVGTDGGLWRTDDAGVTWVNMNSNLNITQFYDVTPHPTNADIVYGGAQDNSSSRRTSSNEWDLSIATGDGFVNIVDSANPNIVFQSSYPANNYPNLARSTQGGQEGTFTWLATTGLDEGGWMWKTTMASAGSHVFVASDRIYRALTSADPFAWTRISNQLPSAISALTTLRIGNTTPAYAGLVSGRVYATLDASAASVTWTDVTGNLPANQTVSDIAIDPTNRQRAFMLYGPAGVAALFRTTVGGTTWATVGAGLPSLVSMQAVAIDPLNLNRIFVGTDVGVYVSTDAGANFVPFVTGFPIGTLVQDLEIDDNPHVLIAGTYGRGAWKVPLETSGNQAPVAGFSFTSSNLTVTFTDSSTDADGTIASRSWNFGDGTSSTLTSPSKTYSAAGSYTVTLTVTDNAGGVATQTKTVTVGASNVLANNVPVTGLSAATGIELRYTMVVPANATGLKFTTTGSNGDADLYAKFGSAPTTSSYTCRSESSNSNETCTIATAQAGTYHVLVKAYSAFTGLSLTGSYSLGSSTQTYTNGTDVVIPNNATVESSIAVTGRSGNAPSNTQVAVNIIHTYIGDLKVDVVAPDGSVYVLHNRTGGSTDNINQTYNVNLSSEPLNGTWRLRVNDNYQLDDGRIDSWSITF